MTDTETAERQDTRYRLDDGDRERFAHIVFSPGRDAGAVVAQAAFDGTLVVALCGKAWVPSRDPKRFPVCPECKEIADSLRRGSQ